VQLGEELHVSQLNLGSEILDSYHYLGVKISCKLTWTKYIKQVSMKARRLVDMLYHGQTQRHY